MVSRFPEDGSLPANGLAFGQAPAERLLDEIRARVTLAEHKSWLTQLCCRFSPPARFTFSLQNDFRRAWVEDHFRELFRACAREVFPFEAQIEFDRAAAAPGPERRPAADRTEGASVAVARASALVHPPRRNGAGDVQLPPAGAGGDLHAEYRFESFVVGIPNSVAHAAAVAVCNAPGRTYNPLFIFGEPGVGKTHLLQAICHQMRSSTALRVDFLRTHEGLGRLLRSLVDSTAAGDHAALGGMNALVVDNIDLLSSDERSQEKLRRLCIDLVESGRQLVLSSRSFPRASSGLLMQLATRFRSGLVARIAPPHFELRVAILMRKAELRSVPLLTEVAEVIARSVDGGVRELEGAFTRAAHFAQERRSGVDLECVRMALDEAATEAGGGDISGSQISITRIIKTVQEHYQVSSRDMISRSKARSAVLPRQVGMFLARNLTPLSLAEIGLHFGGRDHTTVLYAQSRIRGLEESNPQVKSDLRILRHRLSLVCD